MDENKNTISNDETQSTNNMSYSFDFADQVDKTEAPVTPEANSDSASQTNTVSQDSASTVTVQSTSSEVGPEVTPSPVEANSDAVSTPSTDNVGETPAPVAPEAQATPVTPETPVVPVTPVTPETVATDTKENEEDSIELIQDKKATKRFLIILFVVIVAFIIALPFIFSVAG